MLLGEGEESTKDTDKVRETANILQKRDLETEETLGKDGCL